MQARDRRGTQTAAALALLLFMGSVVLGHSAGAELPAEPSITVSGTVLGHTDAPRRTQPPPGGTTVVVALTECADETRVIQGTTFRGSSFPVDRAGAYEGLLFEGCEYRIFANSTPCGGSTQYRDPPAPVAPVAATEDLSVDFSLSFPDPGPPPPEPTVGLSVGRTLDLVDTTRPVDVWPCAWAESRAVPTTVLTPEHVGAQAEYPSPWPVVVLAHGLGGDRSGQFHRGRMLAEHGYVAVIPSFPASRLPANARDLPSQPGDVSFVIDSVLALDADSLDDLHGRVDAERIGISGVSGGAITALLLAFNPCCEDHAIKAVHAEMGFFLGEPLIHTPPSFARRVPLLMLNNRTDTLIPFADNAWPGWVRARGDKYLASQIGECPDQYSHCLSKLTGTGLLDFFDAYLRGDGSAKESLQATFSQADADGVQWRAATGPGIRRMPTP